jgi:inhibitor of KinA
LMAQPDVSAATIVPAGDAALMLQFPSAISPEINDRAMAVAMELQSRWRAILRDVVVGYCTVTVFFDPLRVDAQWLQSEIGSAAAMTAAEPAASGVTVEVPVCYEGELAPDLDDVAAYGGCTSAEVIELHTAGTYRVYMVGFVPGFAYLAEVDPRIAAPRRATPRAAVPAGAVAIAGGQTGVYPSVTPGGWNIIGRTPLKPYDPLRDEACLFHPGDTVRFVRISRERFDEAHRKRFDQAHRERFDDAHREGFDRALTREEHRQDGN